MVDQARLLGTIGREHEHAIVEIAENLARAAGSMLDPPERKGRKVRASLVKNLESWVACAQLVVATRVVEVADPDRVLHTAAIPTLVKRYGAAAVAERVAELQRHLFADEPYDVLATLVTAWSGYTDAAGGEWTTAQITTASLVSSQLARETVVVRALEQRFLPDG